MTTKTPPPPCQPVLGCIADDVTGATDLAINLVQGGMSVIQFLDIPTPEELTDIHADAIVIALKTRSVPAREAIAVSLSALSALKMLGIQRFFFKYCSTFDSTDAGNIGPVASALVDELEAEQTIFCPAFPRNGRTVYAGHLFVHGKLLNESGMEHHPLNPMKDANLLRVLGAQIDEEIGLLPYESLTEDGIPKALSALRRQGCRWVVTDSCDERHLQRLAAAVTDFALITGGSGIARHLPSAYRVCTLLQGEPHQAELPTAKGRSLIISGSCSAATNQQVAWMQSKCAAWQVDLKQLFEQPEAALGDLMKWADASVATEPLLVFSSANPTDVQAAKTHFGDGLSLAIERFLAVAAKQLVADLDIAKLIVAGGETAGAITKELGVRSLRIGPEICPGVPWTESLDARSLALALKSGNFGEPNFFEHALEMLS